MKQKIELIAGDITTLRVDAIVNAANSRLAGGGGVDGAIHRAAGPKLDEECRKIGGCPTGEARITQGYELPADYVIHTVGPVWQGGDHHERELLANCYRNSLKLADENDCRTIAFPSISTGVYGYPADQADRVALETIRDYLKNEETGIEKVTLVAFGEQALDEYRQAYDEVLGAD